MALTTIPCQSTGHTSCMGYLTDTEVQMNVIDPSRTAQEYHNIMELFEEAFSQIHQ